LRQETRTKYRGIVDQKQEDLKALSLSLTKRLSSWAHSGATANLFWETEAENAVQVQPPMVKLLAGESGFEGDLARFGNGLQRSYLLAVLQELADVTNGVEEIKDKPTLLLACEEPELFQHPPQVRHLASVFQQLSDGNAQVLVTTHSPHFVFGQHFESVRMAQRVSDKNISKVTGCKLAKVAERIAHARGEQEALPITAQQAKLQQALQPRLSEMFFAGHVVFVEGIEDVSFLMSWLIARGEWNACRSMGLHFVPVDGKSHFIEPIVLAHEHQIPHFVVFDADGNYQNESQRLRHEKDNKALLRVLGGDEHIPFPTGVILTPKFNQWPSNICTVLRAEVGEQKFDEVVGRVRKSFGEPKESFAKNPVFVGALVGELVGMNGRPMWSLDNLCDELKKFCGASSVPN
jgi:putative ATP-dependent endonuclease of the OLD family